VTPADPFRPWWAHGYVVMGLPLRADDGGVIFPSWALGRRQAGSRGEELQVPGFTSPAIFYLCEVSSRDAGVQLRQDVSLAKDSRGCQVM